MTELEKSILPIREELVIFENKLKNLIQKEENFFKSDIEKFMFSNPKRLRPIFVFLFSKILNINNCDSVFNIALSLELIHSASLIHDDIIDMEVLRRNNPTLYKLYGSKIAVLEGDFILSLALETLSNTNCAILKIFSKYIKKTLQGEIEQNSNLNKVTNIETYLNKTYNKTSNLFMAGLESLFVLDRFSENLKEALIEFLKNYTLAFQIKNDIDNFNSKYQTDIKNGNYTLPVIYFCLDNGIESLNSKCDFEKYIKKTKEIIKNYQNTALENLEKIENSIYKHSLIEICKYTLRS